MPSDPVTCGSGETSDAWRVTLVSRQAEATGLLREAVPGTAAVPLSEHTPDGPSTPIRDAESTRDSGDSLASSVVCLLLLTLIQKGLGLTRSMLLCRWLQPIELGTWGMAQSVMDSAVPLLMLSIPGGFGRYVEYFRLRGQLVGFVRWSAVVSGTSLALGCLLGLLWRGPLAEFVFGSETYAPLMGFCCLAMIPAACFAFSTELLVGLRRGKNASLGHFLRGTLFTLASLGLVLCLTQQAGVLVGAYALSFATAAAYVIQRAFCSLRLDEQDRAPFQARLAVRRMAPALASFCLVDLLNNLFTTVDRYMLINLSTTSTEATLTAVGNYESAAVLPILFAMTATMIARMALPHQAKDWELGDKQRVWQSMNRLLQALGGLLLVGGWMVLYLGDLVFASIFRGQYAAGQQVLPLVVAFYVWTALSSVLVNYFWCVERTTWSALAMALGLAVNIAGNFWLVPKWGINGAAVATLVANAAQWTLLAGFARRNGLPLQPMTIVVSVLPLCLSLPSTWAATGAMLLGLTIALRSWSSARITT